ncbi:MAG: branched-chain amino acid ABC transporter permease [Chloroflexi bacterium]|nr:branched-chain amino acid ABC transporter permease [Chloroflexota bacterium]MBV9892690.1 branched-chain amino acid ABC transporter permease [Chloroflexota bacterium]
MTQVLVQGLVFGLLAGGVYALMSSGMSMIFGVMRMVNLGHAAIMLTGSYIAVTLLQQLGVDPLLSIPIIVAAFLVVGALFERGVLGRFIGGDLALAVLVTLGVANILEGGQGVIWTSRFYTIRTGYSFNTFNLFGLYIPLIRIIAAAEAAVLLVALWLILSRTNLGRSIRATIQNRSVAQLVGVNVARVTMIAFAIGVAMAGAAGPLMGMLYTWYPDSHWLWGGKIVAIIILGGLSSLRGALLASMILGVAEQFVTLGIDVRWAPMVFYIFLLVVMLFRPQGLLGSVNRGLA